MASQLTGTTSRSCLTDVLRCLSDAPKFSGQQAICIPLRPSANQPSSASATRRDSYHNATLELCAILDSPHSGSGGGGGRPCAARSAGGGGATSALPPPFFGASPPTRACNPLSRNEGFLANPRATLANLRDWPHQSSAPGLHLGSAAPPHPSRASCERALCQRASCERALCKRASRDIESRLGLAWEGLPHAQDARLSGTAHGSPFW